MSHPPDNYLGESKTNDAHYTDISEASSKEGGC